MNTQFYYWLISGIILLCLELGHPGLFFFLSFAGAAGVSAIVSLYTTSFMYQALMFIVAGIVWYAVLKVWLRWSHNFTRSHYQSNVYALIGKKCVVIKEIQSTQAGEIKVDGQIWSAFELHKQHIQHGTEVEIVHIKGCHVFVRELPTPKELS